MDAQTDFFSSGGGVCHNTKTTKAKNWGSTFQQPNKNTIKRWICVLADTHKNIHTIFCRLQKFHGFNWSLRALSEFSFFLLLFFLWHCNLLFFKFTLIRTKLAALRESGSLNLIHYLLLYEKLQEKKKKKQHRRDCIMSLYLHSKNHQHNDLEVCHLQINLHLSVVGRRVRGQFCSMFLKQSALESEK